MDALKGLLKEIIGGLKANEKLVRVGKVDPAFGQALQENRAKHKAAHKEIDRKIREFAKQMQKEHEPICERLNAEKADIWEQIYTSLGLTEEEKGKEYQIDHTTGIVNRVEFGPDDEATNDEKPLH